MISYKFRLYPSKEQQDRLELSLDICRRTYNELLSELNSGFTKLELSNYLLDLKACYPEMKNVYSKALQVENDNLECSSCGRIQKIKLSERIYNCSCGLILDRDENAARNILKSAKSTFGIPKSSEKIFSIIKYGRLGISLNGEETNTQSNEQVSSMKLEAYPFNGG